MTNSCNWYNSVYVVYNVQRHVRTEWSTLMTLIGFLRIAGMLLNIVEAEIFLLYL